MSRVNKAFATALIAAYTILWAGGVICYTALGGPPTGSEWAAPAFLFLAAAIVVRNAARQDRLALLLVAIVAWLIELIGVRTGIPFGRYSYTGVLFPDLFGVPLAIGCAWLILFAYVRQLMTSLPLNKWLIPWIGATWMVLLDLLIDPLASGPLHYWQWPDGGRYYGVPSANFFGWFVVSLFLFLGLGRRTPSIRHGTLYIGLSIVFFFSLIALAKGIIGALMAGLVSCLLHAAFTFLRRLRPIKSKS